MLYQPELALLNTQYSRLNTKSLFHIPHGPDLYTQPNQEDQDKDPGGNLAVEKGFVQYKEQYAQQ